MLLTAIYSILKKSEAYNPNLYRKESVASVPADRVISVEEAVAFMTRRGYLVVDPDGVVAS
jgi:hypothetical protein